METDISTSTNKTIFLSMATRGKGWVDHFREISGSRTLSEIGKFFQQWKKKKKKPSGNFSPHRYCEMLFMQEIS